MMSSKKTTSTALMQASTLAVRAASKLQNEARQPNHCLRRLVLSANLIDDLHEQIYDLRLQGGRPEFSREDVYLVDEAIDDDAGNLTLEDFEQREDVSSDDELSGSDSDCSDDSDETVTPPSMMEEGMTAAEMSVKSAIDEYLNIVEDEDCLFELDELAEVAMKRFSPDYLGYENASGAQASVAVVEVADG